MRVCAVLAVVGGGACGAKAPVREPPSAHVPARPAPEGFARCDLVAFGDGTLATYAIRGDRLAKLGEVKLAEPAPPGKPGYDPGAPYVFRLIGDWADRDHLFVRVGERKVVMVTAAGITDVALPDPKTLAIAHPDDASPQGYGTGKEFVNVDLVVEDGSAWWSRCPFSEPMDGGICWNWVNAKLWPTTSIETAESQRTPRAFRWLTPLPRGFTLEPEDRPATCSPPGGAPVPLPERASTDEMESRFDAQWISAEPPRLLVRYGVVPEFADPYLTHTLVLDGCGPKRLQELGVAEPGPGGLWQADGHAYRGATDLGVAGAIRFRPQR